MLRNDGFMSSAMDTARTDVSGLDECKVFFSPDFGLAMEVFKVSKLRFLVVLNPINPKQSKR